MEWEMIIITLLCAYVLNVFLVLLHELSHKIYFSKYGIKSTIDKKYLLKHFGLSGSCNPNKGYGLKMESLSFNNKKDIIIAGIKTDLFVSLVLGCLLGVLLILNINSAKMIDKSIILVCLILLLSRIYATHQNLFSKKEDVDLKKLIKYAKKDK